jgi:hypothetical protein
VAPEAGPLGTTHEANAEVDVDQGRSEDDMGMASTDEAAEEDVNMLL